MPGGTLRVTGVISNSNPANFIVGDGQQPALLQVMDPAQKSFFAGGLTVTNNRALGGTGWIANSVTVKEGGRLEPGASVGTLTVSTLTPQDGAIYDYEIGSSSNDLIAITGNLSLDGGTYVLNILDLGGTRPTVSGDAAADLPRTRDRTDADLERQRVPADGVRRGAPAPAGSTPAAGAAWAQCPPCRPWPMTQPGS